MPEYDSRALWEKLMLDGFQAGLSWLIILRKRPTLRAAFAGFDPEAVAKFGESDVKRLLRDPGIVRSRSKIEATIAGARAFLAMRAVGEDLSTFTWNHARGTSIRGAGRGRTQSPLSVQLSSELRDRGFKFVGPVIVYAWLQATGVVNDHVAGCFRREAVNESERPGP